METPTKLPEGLSNRHIMMISIGGVIGAGLLLDLLLQLPKRPAVVVSYINQYFSPSACVCLEDCQ